jgi:hypothetical protein
VFRVASEDDDKKMVDQGGELDEEDLGRLDLLVLVHGVAANSDVGRADHDRDWPRGRHAWWCGSLME